MTTVIDRSSSDRALHHVQIVVLMATVALTSAVPLAGTAVVAEAMLYRRVRPWFRMLMVGMAAFLALFALTSVR